MMMTPRRLIRGDLIKCVDGRWLDRDGIPVPDIEYIPFDVKKVVQRWQNQIPIEPITEHPLPDIDKLNALVPEEERELGIDGKPRPPYELNYIVYLLNPHDASVLTSINSTMGQRIAFERLVDRITYMRALSGDRVVPIVRLSSAQMKTRYGVKMRPDFKIIHWRELGGPHP
jgi:hypothetical protein